MILSFCFGLIILLMSGQHTIKIRKGIVDVPESIKKYDKVKVSTDSRINTLVVSVIAFVFDMSFYRNRVRIL